ncbi:MAG: C39 family peptidase [Euryarchaeota archaeon]|nr:C39 family peptidase [Euryarchaeota archaeon]
MKSKKGMRVLSLLIAFAFVGVIFVPAVSAGSSVNEQIDKTLVTLEYATKVTQLYLNDLAAGLPGFSEWTGAAVEHDLTFYDTNGDISAYSFSVTKTGKKLGFILVSGIKENYPILEFGKGDILPENAKEQANLIAAKNVKSSSYKLGSVKYLYMGSTFYYAQYTLIDSLQNVKGDVTVDLFNENIVDLKDDISVLTSPKDNSESDVISVNDAWTIFDENIGLLDRGVTVSSSLRGADTIYWVSLYDQPSGYPNSCAPTASGMILSYWRSNGYPNFPSDGDTLILELYSAMETDPEIGTYDSNIEPGIESVCQDHGYYNINAVPDTGSFLFSEVQSEVTADHPMHLAMHGAGTAIGGSTSYGDHSVAVVGWADGAFDAIEINDGWSTTDTRYITFGNWDYTFPVYVRP